MNDSSEIEKTPHHIEQQPEATKRRARKRRRKGRRWLKAILIIVIFLVLTICLAPTILSTRAGTSLIVSVINKGIRGRAEIGDLSLSWFGPIELQRFRLLDTSDREVLKVNRLAVEMGVWRAIKGRERFRQVTIESPSVVLHEQKDGSLSLLNALEPRKVKPKPKPATPKLPKAKPKKRKPERPVPAPRGRVSFRDGSVRVVRHTGQRLSVRDLTGSFNLRSLDQIDGELRLALADGGALSLEVTLRDLAAKGKLGLTDASGTLKIRTPKEVELGPIVSVVSDKAQATGRVNLNLDATLRPGKVTVRYDAGVKELSVRQAVETNVRRVSLNSKGKLDVELGSFAVKKIAGDIDLNGEGVQLATNLTYRRSEKRTSVVFDDILAAVLDGKRIKLPDLSLQASGEADMARLGEAIPSLLRLREDLRLTSGKVLVYRIAVEGGAAPRAEGSLRLTEVSAEQIDPRQRKRRPTSINPLRPTSMRLW